MDWTIQHRLHALKVPVVASHGTARSRLLLILRITDGAHIGWGEAAPIDGYSEATFELCEEALREVLPGLAACDPDEPDVTLESLAFPLPPNSRAALESALRDLAARRAGISVLNSLGGLGAPEVELRCLLPGEDPAEMRNVATDARDAGFNAFKIKLGKDSAVNARAARTVRDAIGPSAHLSGDPNAAWTPSFAESELDKLSGILDLVEQPVEGVSAVRSLGGPRMALALDEAATNHEALERPAAADAVCLKVQAFGGMDLTIQAAARAREAGLKVLVGSTLEGAIGMAGSLVAAQIIQPDLASGLSTLDLFEDRFEALPSGVPFGSAPPGLGLGTDPDGTPC